MSASRCPPVGARWSRSRPTPASSAVSMVIDDAPTNCTPTRSRARERWARQDGRIRQARGWAVNRANTTLRPPGQDRIPDGRRADSGAAFLLPSRGNKMFAILDGRQESLDDLPIRSPFGPGFRHPEHGARLPASRHSEDDRRGMPPWSCPPTGRARPTHMSRGRVGVFHRCGRCCGINLLQGRHWADEERGSPVESVFGRSSFTDF